MLATRKARKLTTFGRAASVAAVTAILAGGAVAGYLAQPGIAAAANGNGAPASERSLMPKSFADVAERVSPAVVNVQVTGRAMPRLSAMSGQMPQSPEAMREFLERFFNDRGNGDRPSPRGDGARPMGAGSGFIIDPEGHIVTNDHVIKEAEKITVTFMDGKTATAKLIGRDPKTDLALLKIDVDHKLPYVKFGNSDGMRVGDWVMTVGNPFGLGHSVTVGVVSARGRTIGAGPYDDFLQIDAPINPGNSGGPAFDVDGNVIGVNSAIFSPNGANVGIGFAIPAALAKDVVADLKSKGSVERGWLGVNIQPVADDIAESLGLKKAEGALVANVDPDGPAAAAGMQAGDVVIAVDGKSIASIRELPRTIATIRPGHASKVTVWRDGGRKDLEVRIGRMPASVEVSDSGDGAAKEADIGVAVAQLDGETAARLGLPENTKGVVVSDVKPASAAERKGLKPGDVIAKVSGNDIRTPDQLLKVIAEARGAGKKSVLALIKRGPDQRFVALPVGTA